MNKNLRKIQKVWRSYEHLFAERQIVISSEKIDTVLNSFFFPGPFYFYLLDFPSLELSYVHPNIEKILGIPTGEASIDALAEHVHSDDAEHFIKCEKLAQHFLFNVIQPEQIKRYKVSYCFRMRTKSGQFHLFLQQAIAIALDDDHRIAKVLGVHCDINHLTDKNNHKISFIGMNGEEDYLGIDVNNSPVKSLNNNGNPLTKREQQIVSMLAEGWTSKDVAETLFVSPDTIRTHRNNIRKKLGVKNTSQMVAACIRRGLI